MLTINQALGTAAVTIVSIAIWLRVRPSRWITIRRCVGTFAYIRHLHPQLFELKVAVGNFGLAPFKVSKHILLTEAECDQALKKGAERIDFTNKKCVVSRVDSNTFGANPICEDRYAVDVVSKDVLVALQQDREKSLWERWASRNVQTSQASQGDTAVQDNLFMFSVFDGHGNAQGHLVADLLTKVLHPSIAQALAGVKSWTSGKIANVIADAVTAVDHDILSKPLTLLEAQGIDDSQDSTAPQNSPAMVHLASLETAGACGLTITVDTASDKMYIANIGDCKAVAGWYDPKSGIWRCDVLNRELTVYDENIAEEVRDRHPEDEREDVVCDLGRTPRILGDCQITHCFGHASMKRQDMDRQRLSKTFSLEYEKQEKPYLSPPYILSEPEMTKRDLHPANGEQLKFVILSTGGLWDELSAEEATRLVAAHLEKPCSKDVAKKDLVKNVPMIPSGDRAAYTVGLPGAISDDLTGHWTFDDDNAATHLVRNCTGRGDPWSRRRLVSMKDGLVRWMGDDVTVSVILFDQVEDAEKE